ncbi:hypothetical protein VNI00_010241 [Paramarasmius palmivorus]|uniref:BTB domain-containing protein n=1 Tax=Paramarasmius palmivorus TaxID=297713 RepID=A0AAW0CIS7_9AGAR
MDTEAHPKCPVEECLIPCDIVLVSNDNKHFGAHKRHLEIYTDSFPNADWDNLTTHEPVRLAESGSVLALLLQFMHNTSPPDLSQQRFSNDNIMDLYKAAGKYGSFVALEACRKEIKSRVKRIKPIESIAIFVQLHEATCPSFPDIDYIVRRTLSLSHADALEHFSKN